MEGESMSIGILPDRPPIEFPAPRFVANEADEPSFRRFTVDEYERMIDADILKEREPVELLEGWIVNKVPRGGDEPALRRWTVDEYHRLIEIGVLHESERVELLKGCVVHKMSRNSPHDTALQKTYKRISAILPAGWDVRAQMAITLSDSEPEPDCAVVVGDEDTYFAQHPTPADIAMVVEVADSSLALDRRVMSELYGQSLIPVYWIVNVRDRQVEIYTDPTGETEGVESVGYRSRQVVRESDTVPVVIRGQEVARLQVSTLLPPV
jgi:Uma2 family endonuclease